jgi:hypothetical protein
MLSTIPGAGDVDDALVYDLWDPRPHGNIAGLVYVWVKGALQQHQHWACDVDG